MLRATLKSLLSRKLRLLLSGLAVVLGVMATSSALIVTETIGKGFDALFSDVFTDLDVQVSAATAVARNGPPTVSDPVPADVLAKVAAVPGVERATGEVFVPGVRVVGADGRVRTGQGPPSFGVAWVDDELVELRSGRGPGAADEIAVNASLAKREGLTVGDRLDVITLAPRQAFTVVGIFGYTGGRDTFGGETRVAFTEPVAQQLLLGRTGVFSAINVRAADGVDVGALRGSVQAAAGPSYTARTGAEVADQRSAGVKQFVGIIRQILLGFAGVALFVGIFLILNTFSILVAQRTGELALLRSLGASRGQVIGSVLVEAVVIGVVASTLGLGLGVGVATLLKLLMESFSGVDLPVAGITVPGSAVFAAYGVGVLVTVIAAALPAMRASRVAPVAAMRVASVDDRPLARLTLGGAAGLTAGLGMIAFALLGGLATGPVLYLLLGGVLLAFIGVAMLTPAISRPVVSLLGRAVSVNPVRLLRRTAGSPESTPGKLGRLNSARNPRRTAITAATLMVGIALVTGVSVLAQSLISSTERLVEEDLDADLVIGGSGTVGQQSGAPMVPTFDPAVLDGAERVPGVRRVVGTYTDAVRIGDARVGVAAGDLPSIADVFGLRAVAGSLRPLRSGEMVVDTDFAADRGLGVGSRVDVVTARAGERPQTVVAVIEPSALLPGPLLSMPDAEAGFRSPRPSNGYLTLADGADTAAVTAQVEALVGPDPEITVQDRSDIVAQQSGQVDTVVAMLYILLGLALVIAVLGIVNTLALSILERTRELGLVRAVGMGRGQVVGMVTVESVVIAVFGALLGVAVGAGLGAAVVLALRDDGVPVLGLPWVSIVEFMALAVVIGLVAAIVPAARAARTDILAAIAHA
jgi:putative ABC transport system permease protein